MRFRRDHVTEELIQDLEAYLQGRFLDRLAQQGQRVPAWAWVNKAAHGTEEELRLWCAVKLVMHDPASVGEAAEYHVVAEALDAVDAGWSLDELQREVLVPFESAVAADTGRVWTPSQLAAAIVESMDAYIDEHGEYRDDARPEY